MKLYNQYCYDSITDVKKSIRSQMIIDGRGVVQTVTSTSGNITVNYLDSTDTLQNYVFTPPSCDMLGYDNSYTGLTTSDSVELGAMITFVLASAWAIKILRRTL